MESSNCYQCKSHTSINTQLSCNHIICLFCIKKQLMLNLFTHLSPDQSYLFKCKCKKGEGKLSIEFLLQLLSHKLNAKCPKHSQIYEDYCPKCRLWICKDCKEYFHNEYFSKHILYEDENINIGKCINHSEDKEAYCKDCKIELCKRCNKNEHNNHLVISFNTYLKQIDSSKQQFLRKTYEDYSLFIKEELNKTEEQNQRHYDDVISVIDQIIEKLLLLKNNYLQKEKERKIDLLKKHIQLIDKIYNYYYREMNRKEIDIHLIKFLHKANCELKQIKCIESSFKLYLNKVNEDIDKEKANCFCFKFIFRNLELKNQFSQGPMHCERILRMNKGWINCLVLLFDGRLASGSGDWAGSSDKTIHIWNLNENKEDFVLRGHLDDVLSLIQLNDGKLASGSLDMTIKIWDLNLKCELYTLKGHEGNIQSLIQLKDGRLASGSGDNTIRMWDIEHSNKEKGFFPFQKLVDHIERVRCIIQLQDERIASGSYDNTIKIWDIFKLKCKFTLKEHVEEVYCLIQLQDSRLASGSRDSTIKIWNITLMILQQSITGHKQCILTFLQLKDGRLVSGSRDKTIKVWKIEEKIKEQFTLSGHCDIVNSLVELGNSQIASSSLDKTIRIWSH